MHARRRTDVVQGGGGNEEVGGAETVGRPAEGAAVVDNDSKAMTALRPSSNACWLTKQNKELPRQAKIPKPKVAAIDSW